MTVHIPSALQRIPVGLSLVQSAWGLIQRTSRRLHVPLDMVLLRGLSLIMFPRFLIKLGVREGVRTFIELHKHYVADSSQSFFHAIKHHPFRWSRSGENLVFEHVQSQTPTNVEALS